jgi:AraC-like DNA-binding protein
MTYFNDIQFVGAGVIPECGVRLDQVFPGTYSLEFILSGSMYFGIDHGGQYTLEQPALFWHHPAHSYQYGSANERGWFHHWVLMRGERARRIVEEGFMPLADIGYLPVKDGRGISLLFQALAQMVNHELPRRQAEAVLAVERILAMAIAQGTPGLPREAELAALADRIQIDPGRDFDFQRIAKDLELSYSHFRRLFRQATGLPPHRFFVQCRLRRAAQLLQDEQRRIGEVARSVGFDDPASFSRAFTQFYGLPPRDYRSQTCFGNTVIP